MAETGRHQGTSGRTTTAGRLRSWAASIAAGALIAGSLVAVGVGVQQASAAGLAPELDVAPVGTYIAGEDLQLRLTFTGNSAAGDQYNLGAALVLPEGVVIENTGTLGTAKSFPRTPGGSRVIPGSAESTAAQCAALGLEPVTPGQIAGRCQVPAGMQYVVFENISDLPAGASTTHTLTLRPDATAFPVGSTIDVQASAFTNAQAQHLPHFPGSSGAGGGTTSDAGVPDPRTTSVDVNALRIEKSEPSPDGELLRGAHDNSTTYTLRVWHTGEGDLENVVVTDLLPAGLEYLGLGAVDHTTAANGTQGAVEYPGAQRLDASTPDPAASTYSGDRDDDVIDRDRNRNDGTETVETVLEGGEVFTKVTWNVGQLLASGLASYNIVGSDPQAYPGTAGQAGFFEIRYRAAVPLFENTMDFGGATPGVNGEQTANLDNNRGPSTRHGYEKPGTNDPGAPNAEPRTYTNRAEVTGEYGADTVGDDDSHTVSAVDVRVLKSVDRSVFEQSGTARYTLRLDRSEYVTATVPGPEQRPYRLVDDLADGLCPIFPAGTAVAGGAALPDLVLGDPRTGGATHDVSASDWNDALTAAGVSLDCHWPSGSADVSDDALEGAKVIGIAFDSATGHFFTDLEIDPADALETDRARTQEIQYSARQNKSYVAGEEGLTTSGDVVNNTAEIYAETRSIPALDGVTSGSGAVADGAWNAWDDDSASLHAAFTGLEKRVLPRDYSGTWPDTGSIAAVAESAWEKNPLQPFAVGDEVWYRIDVVPPQGTDVRNPKLTDFLPAGVTFDDTDGDGNGVPDGMVILPSAETGIGDCAPSTPEQWVSEFVDVAVDGQAMTFTLGQNCGLGGTDRFLPLATTLTVFFKVTVADQAAFGEVDLPQNQAKYQQNNVEGEIHFDRSSAEIVRDQGVQLKKGITQITQQGVDLLPAENPYNSDVDGDEMGEAARVRQGDLVEFRLDVSAPFNSTTGYTVWDALPTGIGKADLAGFDHASGASTGGATAATVAQTWVAPTGPGDPAFPTGSFTPTETPVTSGWTATAYDPGDPGRPSGVNPAFSNRTIVVWQFDDTVQVPGSKQADAASGAPALPQGLTLGYTVVVPQSGAPAEVGQRYVNYASVLDFEIPNRGGGSSKLIVNGPAAGDHVADRRDPGADEYAFEDAENHASDPSNFEVIVAGIDKSLHRTEIAPAASSPAPDLVDANNPQNAIVQGEYAEFDLSVTIPAHTTVRNGVLRDDGVLRWSGNTLAYTLADAQLVAPASLPTGFSLGWNGADQTGNGSLTFPETYTNTTGADQEFTVRLKAWIEDRDDSHPSRTDIVDSTVLTNTARFSYTDPNTGRPTELSDDQTVTYREPQPQIAKSNDTGGQTVGVNGVVTYTLRVGGSADRPASYDNVVVDDVPAGLSVRTGAADFTVPGAAAVSVVVGAVPAAPAADTVYVSPGAAAGTGGTITWRHESFAALKTLTGPNQVALTYVTDLASTVGAGEGFRNDASITGQTLPASLPDATERRGDRSAGANSTITADTATIDKGVRVKPQTGNPAYAASAAAPVGQTLQYQVRVSLEPRVNYYDIEVRDSLPAGLQLQSSTVQVAMTTGSGAPADVTGDWTRTNSGNDYTWSYAPNGGDLAWNGEPRTLIFTYDVLLSNAIGSGNGPLNNTASVAWKATPNGQLRTPLTDTASVTVQNPELRVVKDVRFNDAQGTSAWGQQASGGPDRTLNYRIVVQNHGAATAYHNRITDTLPAGVVNARNFTVNGVAVAAPNTVSQSGNLITWNLPNGILVGAGNTVTLGYTADFAPSTQQTSDTGGTAGWKVNTARVAHYESWPRTPADPNTATGRQWDNPTGTGTSDTAQARPLFPRVTLTKAAADPSRNAYVGEPFEWVLTATNSGAGAAQKVVLTDALPANWEFTQVVSIVKGGAAQPPANPTGAPDGPLVWTFGGDAVNGAPAATLAPGQSIVIRYTATPKNPEALTAPGVGSARPHVNTLSAVTSDRTNATANQTRSHTGPNATDQAFLREANLRLEKTAVGGVTGGVPAGHVLHGVPEGSWVIGQLPESGVYTQPQWQIRVTNQGPDTAFGPFTVTETPTAEAGVTIGSWTAYRVSGGTETLIDDDLVPDGDGRIIIGGNTTSIPVGAGEAIVLRANVEIAATADPDAVLENTADVRGRTYENPSNFGDNADDEEKPLTDAADLRIVKTVSGAPNAGGAITWTLTPFNAGPTVSRNAPTAITITDVVPAGVTVTTDPSNALWTATAPGGFPAAAGTAITFVYQGSAAMPIGAQPSIALSGTVDAAWTPTSGPAGDGSIVNAAVIHPGATNDPNYVDDPAAPGYPTQNNYDDVVTSPTFDTALGITKKRVVSDGAGGWVDADAQTPVPPVHAGDPVHYRLSVTNTGPAVARGVTLTDDVPTGLGYLGLENVSPATWSHAKHANAVDDVFTLTSDGGTLPVGETRQVVVQYSTSPSTPATTQNCISAASSDNTATVPPACDDFTSDRFVNLSIVKDVIDAPNGAILADGTDYRAGDTVTYRMVVTNRGPSDALGPITVTDTLPAGLAYVANSATVGGAAMEPAAPAAQTLSWTVLPAGGTLPVAASGNTITIEFQAAIAAGREAENGVVNTASVTMVGDTESSDNVDSATIDVLREASMEIEKNVAGSVWHAGEEVVYTLDVSNAGPSVGDSARIADTLPAGLTMLGMSGDNWNCTAPVGTQSGTCDYAGASVPLGALDPITVRALVATNMPAGADGAVHGNPFRNTAALTWTDTRMFAPGADPRHDEDTADITVTPQADLGIVKTAVDENGDEITEANAGDAARYRLQVTNHGPSDAAADLVVTDTLPLGVAYVGPLGTTSANWNVTAGAYDPAAQQTVTFTRVAGGNSVGLPIVGGAATAAPDILFQVRLDPSLRPTDAAADPAVEPLLNTATVRSATPEPAVDPHPNTDTAELQVTRSADVSVVKGHVAPATGADEFEVGDAVEFTLDVANAAAGPSNASGIVVTDTVPAGLAVTSAAGPVLDGAGDPTGWTIDSIVFADPANPGLGATVTASYAGELAPGESAPTLTIAAQVTVEIGDGPSAVNRACVTGLAAGETNTTADPCDTESVDVVPLADLAIEKAVTTADPRAGMPIEWSIAVRNLGPSASLSTAGDPITVVDEVPAGVEAVADPSTAEWAATVTRSGTASSFPARAGDVITWNFQGDRIAANPDPAFELTLAGRIVDGWISGSTVANDGGPITNVVEINPGVTRDPHPLDPGEACDPADQDATSNAGCATAFPDDATALVISKERMVQVDGEWVRAASLSPTTPPFVPGETVTYEIDVWNTGPADARDVQIVDAIPAGLSNPVVTPLPGLGDWTPAGDAAAAVAPCETGLPSPYPAGDCLTVSLDGSLLVGLPQLRGFLVTFDSDPSLDPAAPLVNWAQARATNVPEDERPFDDDDTRNDNQARADLTIAKTASADRVLAGSTVDYRLVITNNGPSIARGPIAVTDQLPVGMGYVPESAVVTWEDGTELQIEPAVTESAGSEMLAWTPVRDGESLAPGETVTIDLQTSPAEGVFSLDGLVNIGEVAGPDDYDPTNNASQATVVVEPLTTLVTEKTAVGDFQVGKTGTYRIAVSNFGPTADPGPITVTDVLPYGLTYRGSPALPAGASVAVNGQQVVWTLENGLAVDETAVLTLEVNVGAGAYPKVANTVAVSSAAEKTSDSRLTSTAEAPVRAADVLAITGGDLAAFALLVALLLLLGGASVMLRRRREVQS